MKLRILLGLVAIIALSGCADHVTLSAAESLKPVGFWFGLWHGMIMPFAWIVSLFDSDVTIYAIYNNGGWYNFGFVLGAGSLVSSTSSKKRK